MTLTGTQPWTNNARIDVTGSAKLAMSISIASFRNIQLSQISSGRQIRNECLTMSLFKKASSPQITSTNCPFAICLETMLSQWMVMLAPTQQWIGCSAVPRDLVEMWRRFLSKSRTVKILSRQKLQKRNLSTQTTRTLTKRERGKVVSSQHPQLAHL